MSPAPTRVDFPSEGGVTVAAYRWDPHGEPTAIVQLAHGVGEYARRYQPLVDYLLGEGYVVYAHDHRGHGSTARSPQEHGVLGEDGWAELVNDYGRMSAVATTHHPGLPLVLVAHSLGSFAAQQYLLDHSADVSAEDDDLLKTRLSQSSDGGFVEPVTRYISAYDSVSARRRDDHPDGERSTT